MGLKALNPFRHFPKWAVVLTLSVVFLLGAAFLRHGYLVWKEHQLVLSARVGLQKEDLHSLSAALDQLLRVNPKNIDACRLSAQAMLKVGNPKALPWLRRVVELDPGKLEDKMALAEAAWRFKLNQEAAKWLDSIEAEAKGRADYQDLAGRVAESFGQLDLAQRHYAEAARLEPENRTYRLRLATLNLTSPNRKVRDLARGVVEEQVEVPGLKASALRALVLDALKEVQTARALRLAQELDASPGHLFSDRLLYLQVLHLLDTPDFHQRLAETEEAAAQVPEWILPLIEWMNSDHLAILALDWVQRLPKEATAPIPIRMEIARSYAAYGDWKRLQFFLADEKWDDSDYLKQAYLARCYRERDAGDIASRNTWSEAVNLAGSNGDRLMKLAMTAQQWGWQTEAEETLWRAAMKSNKTVEALNGLCQFYFSKRNTAGLFRVYTQLVELNPEDKVALNNFANISFMLGQEMDRAMTIACDLYGKEPGSPVYTSTYAFALFRTGKNAQALEIMEKLKPDDLKIPSVAAYYSAILDAAGRTGAAQEYRKLASGASLLPEEEAILNVTPQPEPTPAPTPNTPEPKPTVSPGSIDQ
jgi:tetratricopeptide (TPR) repeat protein